MEMAIKLINNFPDEEIDKMFDTQVMTNTGVCISSDDIVNGMRKLEQENPDLIRAFSKR